MQRVRTLDHAIETLGRRKVHRLDPPVRAALRLGAYQLGYVDGVPRYAAVNESVELVRAAGLDASGRVHERGPAPACRRNRRAARGFRRRLPREAALKHSYPDWIAETWWRDLGEAAALALMRAQNEPAEVAVRLVRGEIEGTPDPEIPGAGSSTESTRRALAEGRIWPQSRASQLVGLVVGARAGERTLDVCAAPGGKATMLAGEVVAVDVNEARARELEETARRLGAVERPRRRRGRPLASAGARRLRPRARRCALLGPRVLNRRPDLRWRAEPLPELQPELLRAAAERVRPGGTIVYSVCTINADEAEAIVDASGLEVDSSLADEWPRFRHPGRPEFLQTLPHVHGTAGFFVARLRG